MKFPDNAELVLLAKNERWSGFVSDIERLLDTDREADKLIELTTGLLSDNRSPTTHRLLGDTLLHLNDSSETEKREDDQDWFQGIDDRFKTKSAYIKYNCEMRIRGYMKEVKLQCLQSIHTP
ncbi:hypothetical protein J4Q44_G00259770 [Coregonus suidteri]|uniref:DNA fragmentation factor 40 C-terminal domain-containing protein n=1 Tax=Coregonus suidteri TaxID=861788 RepID=A0AAN8L3R4_9TELE